MYFIDRGSYISNNNNSHCFDSISQLLGKRGLPRATFQEPRKGWVVLVAPWVSRQGVPGRKIRGVQAQGSEHTGARQQPRAPYSHLTTDLPLTPHCPGPAESNLGLAQAGMSPGQCQVSAPMLVEVVPGFGLAPPRILPSPPPPAPLSIPVAWTWLSFPPWTPCWRFSRCLHRL